MKNILIISLILLANFCLATLAEKYLPITADISVQTGVMLELSPTRLFISNSDNTRASDSLAVCGPSQINEHTSKATSDDNPHAHKHAYAYNLAQLCFFTFNNSNRLRQITPPTPLYVCLDTNNYDDFAVLVSTPSKGQNNTIDTIKTTVLRS